MILPSAMNHGKLSRIGEDMDSEMHTESNSYQNSQAGSNLHIVQSLKETKNNKVAEYHRKFWKLTWMLQKRHNRKEKGHPKPDDLLNCKSRRGCTKCYCHIISKTWWQNCMIWWKESEQTVLRANIAKFKDHHVNSRTTEAFKSGNNPDRYRKY